MHAYTQICQYGQILLSCTILIKLPFLPNHAYSFTLFMPICCRAYSLPKETVTIIMMLYKNMKSMVHSPNGDTDFYIVTGALQGDTLTLYL